MKKNGYRVFIAFLLLLFVIPIIFTDWNGGAFSATENRMLAPFPVSFDQETYDISVSRSEVSNWINDNIGCRDLFVNICTTLKVKCLGISTSDKVQRGKDGWFFYTQDSNIEIALQQYPNFDEKVLAGILERQLRIKEKLQTQGIEYVLVLPPSKVSVYPENLIYGNCTVCKTPVDILADYLEAHSDLKVVRVKDALLRAKQNSTERLYFKTDTHWTEYGAYAGYVEVVESLNEWGLIQSGPADVSFSNGTYTGEFSAMLGNASLLAPETVLESTIDHPKAMAVTDGDLYRAFEDSLAQVNNRSLCQLFQNAESADPTILMYGDSMFGQWNLGALLAENSAGFAYVWDSSIQQEMIDVIKPQIVLYEITERNLNLLGRLSNSYSLEVLSNPHAQILSEEVPSQRMVGQACSLSVTVKNTGSQAWSELDMIRCGLFINGVDTGRAYLPDGLRVEPGESYTFYFHDYVPSEHNEKIEFVMLQETIAYFS